MCVQREQPDVDSLVTGWMTRIDPARREAALRVLDVFGLAGIYDGSPLPVA